MKSRDKAEMEHDMQNVRSYAVGLKNVILDLKQKWDVDMWDEMIVYLIESKELED
jgi:hypothetical protein